MISRTLPPETVRRSFPKLHHPDDAGLFAAEIEKTFPAVTTQTVTGDFFPAGWHADLGGWKGLLKGWAFQATTRRKAYVPSADRTPLIATDRLSNGYFHWVTETLPRLWWLREEQGILELVLPWFASRFTYMAESLAIFPELSFQIASPAVRWRVKDALLAPAVAPSGNFRPQFMVEVGQAWRTLSGAQAPHRKLYISRARATRRRVANEGDLRAVLEARGFETVCLEGLPFADQVRLLAETSELVSNHGAGLTNMLFMVPGTRVTEIRLQGDAHNNCYFSLARALGLEYDYRLARPAGAGSDPHSADVVVDVEGLK